MLRIQFKKILVLFILFFTTKIMSSENINDLNYEEIYMEIEKNLLVNEIYDFYTSTNPQLEPSRSEVILSLENGIWHCSRFISTFELLERVTKILQNRPISGIFNENQINFSLRILEILRLDEEKYGRFAGLCNWNPSFTEMQLREYCSLIASKWEGEL